MSGRFTMDNPNDWGFPITDNDTGKVYSCASNQLMKDLCDLINKIVKENEQLKKENNKLHQKIFEMRTNIALERTDISRQTYTGKKNEKEYLDVKEFLDEIEKW